MIHGYELFERFPDGSTLWRAFAPDLRDAVEMLEDLASNTGNEFYALNIQTGQIMARANEKTVHAAHA
jgi:hypothetical protein